MVKKLVQDCKIRRQMVQEDKNLDKEGIPGSGRSMHGYILTYSRIRAVGSQRMLIFESAVPH